MKAAVLRAYKEPLQVEELAVDAPHVGEVAVRVAAAGVCHSDLYVLEGATPVPPPSSRVTRLSASWRRSGPA
jgi:succinate semialdehyde reductase (NADPH)